MKSDTIRKNIQYIGAALVIFTTLILAFIIIPGLFADKTPGLRLGMAVKMLIVIIILHLLICYTFRRMIIVNKRGSHLNMIVFIITGIGLLILGLFLSDGAFSMLGHANMQFVAISWFVCVVNDIIAGILVFIALFLQPKKMVVK
ncbi:MAG TPA: hypothetical protein VLB50_02385 [Ignavibacteriaceae bacterium]|nr:hypothetical protein [Ignavibacteriaceae bacterium]